MDQVRNGVRHRRRGLALAALALVAACASAGRAAVTPPPARTGRHADGAVGGAVDRAGDRGAHDRRDHTRDHAGPDDHGAAAQP